MLEIIIIGSGNRVIKDYLPILIYLEKTNKLKVTGVVNRTKKNSQYLLKQFKCKYYKNMDELFVNNKKKLNIILSVNLEVKDSFMKYLISKKCNILVDTPPTKSLKLLNKVNYYENSIYFAEDFLLNPITLRFLNLVKKKSIVNFIICNKNYTANYHFFSLIKHFINEKILNCNVKSILNSKNLILKEKISYNEKVFISETFFNHRNLLKNNELYFKDLNNFKISTNDIFNQLQVEYVKNKDNFFLYLNDYLKRDYSFLDSNNFKFKKIMKLIGLKSTIELWLESFSLKSTKFYSSDYASEIMLLLKSSSISRRLNVSIYPAKIKFLKYFI